MKTKSQLQAEVQAHLAAARKIIDAVEAEKRDFTPEEREKVNAHIGEAKLAKQQLEALDPEAARRRKAEADEGMRQQILALTGDADPEYQRQWDAKHRRTGGRPAGAWSKAFREGLPYQPATGAKNLLPPAGSVSVGQLSSTIGTLDDEGRAETILQVIPIQSATGDAFSYLRETVRDHAAAPVPIGTKKPQSTYTLERVDDRIHTIAHLSEPIPRQWLDDAPMLAQYLDQVLRQGVVTELEYQVIQGSGLNDDLPGILNTANVKGQAFDTDVITTARKAITQLETMPVSPNAWFIHPEDWEQFELSVESGAGYIMGAPGTVPVDRARRRLWGLPVVLTLGVPQGTGLVADWRTAVTLYEREGVRIDWSEAFIASLAAYDEEAYTGFQSNQVQFRAEGRWGLAIHRPGAIVEVDFTEGS